MTPKIIVNAIPLLGKITGIGRYVHEICSVLVKDTSIDLTFYYGYISNKLSLSDSKKTILGDIVDRLIRFNTAKRIVRLVIYDILSRLVKKKFKLYWEPNNLLLESIPSDIKLTTIHDLSVLKFPEFHPKDRVSFFMKNLDDTIKNSDHIITVSKTIKSEIMESFGISEDKITFIYNGYRREIFKRFDDETRSKFRREYRLPERFILYVGTIEPRKNLKNLLTAYGLLPIRITSRYKLLLVGHYGWENEEIFESIRKMSDNVFYLGYKDDNSLSILYNLCDVMVYPSFYEGFGLPPLEAMACGAPVITSNTSSMAELYNDCALLIDPHDPYSIRDAIERVIEDDKLRNSLKQKGLAKAQEFSWEKSGYQHLNLIKKLVNAL